MRRLIGNRALTWPDVAEADIGSFPTGYETLEEKNLANSASSSVSEPMFSRPEEAAVWSNTTSYPFEQVEARWSAQTQSAQMPNRRNFRRMVVVT